MVVVMIIVVMMMMVVFMIMLMNVFVDMLVAAERYKKVSLSGFSFNKESKNALTPRRHLSLNGKA